jgi:VWFA-related protein
VIPRYPLVLAAVLLVPFFAGAQAASPEERAARQVAEASGPGAQPASTYLPEGLIHLDVVVNDAAGRLVAGLGAKDFTVFDNGQKEPMVSFTAYMGAVRPDPPATVTLVVDTLKVQGTVESEVRQRVEKFLREGDGHLAQPVTVVLLDDTGLWRVGAASDDGKALADALEHNRVAPWSGRAGSWTNRIDQTMGGFERGPGARGDLIGDILHSHPGEGALEALGAIAVEERRNPGRKLLVWVGPGLGAGSDVNPEEPVQTGVERRAVFDKILWFSTLLRLTGMQLCSVSATVPLVHDAQFPWDAVHPVMSPEGLSPLDGGNVIELNRRVLAKESGGEAFEFPPADPLVQIGDCMRGANTFYALTFNPAPAQQNDEYHAIEVKVRFPNLTARTDTLYYDQPFYEDAPDPAIRKVTIAELEVLLRAGQNAADADLARQLAGVELTERAGGAEIAQWTEALKGRKSREALLAVADASAFMDPPADRVLPDPAPDAKTRKQMVGLALDYLNQTIPRLPNFYARRTASSYEETPSFYVGDGKFKTPEPLHMIDTAKTTVLFRNGAEVVDAKAVRRGLAKGAMGTYGTFGPILGAARSALTTGVSWSRWEKEESGERLAVFRYRVQMAVLSRYEVTGCCLPDGDGTAGFSRIAGYHGEMAIDPASGALRRMTVEADLSGFVPLDRADIMVAYGPVEIGGKTYICPLRSVSLMRSRSINELAEWRQEEFYRAWGPFATKLNDFRFDDYHTFRASVRMLPSSGQ